MGTFRHFLRRRPGAAWWLLALALAMKLIVPSGFMPSFTAAGIRIVLCPDAGPVPAAMPGMAMGHKHDTPAPGKADGPCAFAGLAAPGLSGADPILLAAAIAAIVAAGVLIARTLPPPQAAYLRPPLRGPPRLG